MKGSDTLISSLRKLGDVVSDLREFGGADSNQRIPSRPSIEAVIDGAFSSIVSHSEVAVEVLRSSSEHLVDSRSEESKRGLSSIESILVEEGHDSGNQRSACRGSSNEEARTARIEAAEIFSNGTNIGEGSVGSGEESAQRKLDSRVQVGIDGCSLEGEHCRELGETTTSIKSSRVCGQGNLFVGAGGASASILRLGADGRLLGIGGLFVTGLNRGGSDCNHIRRSCGEDWSQFLAIIPRSMSAGSSVVTRGSKKGVSQQSQLHEFDIGSVDIVSSVGDVEIGAVSEEGIGGSVDALLNFNPSIAHRNDPRGSGSVENIISKLIHPSVSVVHDIEAGGSVGSNTRHHLSIKMALKISVIWRIVLCSSSQNASDIFNGQVVGGVKIIETGESKSFRVSRAHLSVNARVGIHVGDGEVLRDAIKILDAVWNVAIVILIG